MSSRHTQPGKRRTRAEPGSARHTAKRDKPTDPLAIRAIVYRGAATRVGWVGVATRARPDAGTRSARIPDDSGAGQGGALGGLAWTQPAQLRPLSAGACLRPTDQHARAIARW